LKQDLPGLVYAAIEEIAREFCENPFMYLYESDLQSRLTSILYLSTRSMLISLDARSRKPACFGDRTTIQTSILKTEYPSIGVVSSLVPTPVRRLGRFDIALIDEENPVRYTQGMTNDVFWTQPVRVGIEIKYWQGGEPKRSRLAGLQGDLDKLATYGSRPDLSPRFLGIALLFIQSYADTVQAADVPKGLVEGLRPQATGIVGHIIGVKGKWTVPYKRDEPQSGGGGLEPTLRGGNGQ
jgi:hypothetical protein